MALGLLVSGCSAPPRSPPERGPVSSGAGRFVLSGEAIGSSIQGRYEWGKGERSEWVVFTDPWGNALGELRQSPLEGSTARAWELRDESGRILQPSAARQWLEERFGLGDQDLDGRFTELSRGLIQANMLPRTIEIRGQRGAIRMRVIPDLRAGPAQ